MLNCKRPTDATQQFYDSVQVVILVDEADAACKAFWSQHNSQVLAMAESGQAKVSLSADSQWHNISNVNYNIDLTACLP